jgi:CubicO group peptidase (beta-lactamase class C family)
MNMSLNRGLFGVIVLSLLWSGCKSNATGPEPLPPVLNVGFFFGAISGVEFAEQIEVSDPNGLNVTVSIDGLPQWLTFFTDQKILQGIPSVDDIGIITIVVTADNGSKSVSKDVILRVFATQSELALQEKVESAMGTITTGMNGVSVAVVDANGNIYRAYTGRMGSGLTHPHIAAHSKYRIASATKPMTTAVILRLVEDGKLNLNDMVTDHILTQLANANAITIRQLLTHTSGVYDHLNTSSFWSAKPLGSVWSFNEIIQLAIVRGPLFNPGSSYAYSNTGFVILGAIIEKITGLAIQDAYKQLLFDPLELEDTIYDNFSNLGNPVPNLVFNTRSYEYHLTSAGPSGAIAASASDVAMFGWKVYGGRFVNSTLSNQMSVNYGSSVGGQNYGLGTRIWTVAGIRHHGHTGNLMNYRNILMYVPEADIAIAMHTHDPHSNWNTLIDQILIYAVNNFSTNSVKRLPDYMYEGETREELIGTY